MLNSNTWNHLTMCKQMNSDSFKNNLTYKLFTYKSLTHIHINLFLLVQWEKKTVNTLKWIGLWVNLVLGHLFFFHMCFWHFKSSSGSKWFECFPLVFIVATVLIGLWFLLIPGFVSNQSTCSGQLVLLSATLSIKKVNFHLLGEITFMLCSMETV